MLVKEINEEGRTAFIDMFCDGGLALKIGNYKYTVGDVVESCFDACTISHEQVAEWLTGKQSTEDFKDQIKDAIQADVFKYNLDCEIVENDQ